MRKRELASLPFLGLAYVSLRIAWLLHESILTRMGLQKIANAMRQVLRLYPYTTRDE